ncbi:MAG: type IV secretory system conjugative DNA transfer family protein [Phycisphaerales bacterium JB040]
MSRATPEPRLPDAGPPLYRQDEFPARPTRSTLRGAPRHVRLLSGDDLDRLESCAGGGQGGGVRLPATLLVETTACGSRLESREYSGLPIRTETRRRNTLVCGSTGSGKTYRYALPAIDATLRQTDDSVVVLNIKGEAGTREIAELAALHRPESDVVVFSPADPERSVAWNPVAFARRHGLLETLVEHLVETTTRGTQDSGYWESVARRAISAALSHRAVDSLAELHDVFNDRGRLAQLARACRDRTLLEFGSFVDSGSHNAATNLADITARLFPYSRTAGLRSVLSSRNGLDPVALLESDRPVTLVVEANESTFRADRPVLGLFFSMLFKSIIGASEPNGGELPTPLSVFLDEFGAIGRIHDFETVANTSRSRRVSITAMVQTLGQIAHHYQDASHSVLGAFNSKLFLCSGLELCDREHASRQSGSVTAVGWRETQTFEPGEGGFVPGARSQDFFTRPLLTPDDFAPPEHPVFGPLAVLFTPDHPPALLHPTAAWEIPHIARAMNAARAGLSRDAGADPDEHALGLNDAPPRGRRWWSDFRRRMRRHPGVVRRVLHELRRRDATIAELHEAVQRSGVRSIRGNLMFLDLQRLAEHERAHGVSRALLSKRELRRARDRQARLFEPCPYCGHVRAWAEPVCPGCADRPADP